MVQFLSIIFFSWISSIFVGFFKSSPFFVSSCIKKTHFFFKDNTILKVLLDSRRAGFTHKLDNYSLRPHITRDLAKWQTSINLYKKKKITIQNNNKFCCYY